MEDRSESLYSLAFSVCQNIANRTGLKLFYAVDEISDPSFQHLIQSLHETSIQIVSISHHSELTDAMVTDYRKNIIFNFNDVSELFNFIFNTILQSESLDLNSEIEEGLEQSTNPAIYQTTGYLPRFCIKIEELHYRWPREGCREEINISSADLEHGSYLTDSVFNATRGFFRNKIWNFRNHLIFLLKNVDERIRGMTSKVLQYETLPNFEMGRNRTLSICFKFFWRFFKGQKTVICHPSGCERYDPFAENLIFYPHRGETDSKDFFAFSWTNMHKKSVLVSDDYSRQRGFQTVNHATWSNWYEFYFTVFEHLQHSANFTHKYWQPSPGYKIEDAWKYDVCLIPFETGIVLEGTDYSQFDYSVSVDTSALCVATPHSGYMSQGLVIFESFSSVVWIFISVTIASLVIMQYVFQYSQCELFHRLYTDAEVDYYRETSALLTVYAYFICGSPPSLHLGHLFTGKVLFSILSFSTIIISTVFLSSMTTLLSDSFGPGNRHIKKFRRVRYDHSN
ncbi:unnamed protein product [Bemisia tabaci]|uniref:Ionotropic receptor n=1 Tax=Bemisia tabaci TaxID=7038 RepID=A0A9P0AMJ5_BEMTA|nr:unnamed protein product [Bemisia tabaci]